MWDASHQAFFLASSLYYSQAMSTPAQGHSSWWGGFGCIKIVGESMEDILRQIEATNEAGYYYVALFSVLTLPDICAALESINGETTGDRYADWYDRICRVWSRDRKRYL
jgi:hypothetical protein